MNKKKNNKDNNISIREIDKYMDDFYIDKNKIENIKASKDLKLWVKESIDQAQSDIEEEKRINQRKNKIVIGIIFLISSSFLIYSPEIVHKFYPIQAILKDLNDVLKVDEITSKIGIDKIIPKAIVEEKGKIKFEKAPKYNIENLN
ncbi:hypothetical protein [Romboutsia lituseburensis]|uniref:hypothetical protein n=1 Tax=Romboutsia lituseburensis TaxID=1537 RepID=UPI00215AC2E3|nr:hypothetical protein [Romboutsia lituseburensis]MCR8744785.1 hypothetical protein [Romboutsia lituseburensis]